MRVLISIVIFFVSFVALADLPSPIYLGLKITKKSGEMLDAYTYVYDYYYGIKRTGRNEARVGFTVSDNKYINRTVKLLETENERDFYFSQNLKELDSAIFNGLGTREIFNEIVFVTLNGLERGGGRIISVYQPIIISDEDVESVEVWEVFLPGTSGSIYQHISQKEADWFSSKTILDSQHEVFEACDYVFHLFESPSEETQQKLQEISLLFEEHGKLYEKIIRFNFAENKDLFRALELKRSQVWKEIELEMLQLGQFRVLVTQHCSC